MDGVVALFGTPALHASTTWSRWPRRGAPTSSSTRSWRKPDRCWPTSSGSRPSFSGIGPMFPFYAQLIGVAGAAIGEPQLWAQASTEQALDLCPPSLQPSARHPGPTPPPLRPCAGERQPLPPALAEVARQPTGPSPTSPWAPSRTPTPLTQDRAAGPVRVRRWWWRRTGRQFDRDGLGPIPTTRWSPSSRLRPPCATGRPAGLATAGRARCSARSSTACPRSRCPRGTTRSATTSASCSVPAPMTVGRPGRVRGVVDLCGRRARCPMPTFRSAAERVRDEIAAMPDADAFVGLVSTLGRRASRDYGPSTRCSAAAHCRSVGPPVAPGLVAAELEAARAHRPQVREPPGQHPGGPRLHQHVAQRGTLDRPGDHRQAGRVRGELAQQLVAHSPADHVHDADVLVRERRRLPDGPPVGERERVEDAADRLGLRLRGRLPGPGGLGGDAGGHVAGRQERRAVEVDHRGQRRDAGGRREQVRQVGGQPGLVPRADRLLEHPQAHDVAQVPDRAVDPGLVGEVGGAALLGEHRPVQLEADQRPGPAGDVREVVARRPAPRRRPTRCRASRPSTPAPTRAARRPRARGPAARPGRAAAGAGVLSMPSRSARSVAHVRRRRVEQAGGRRVGHLRDPRAGQPVAEQVRDQQRPCGPRRAPPCPARRPAGTPC